MKGVVPPSAGPDERIGDVPVAALGRAPEALEPQLRRAPSSKNLEVMSGSTCALLRKVRRLRPGADRSGDDRSAHSTALILAGVIVNAGIARWLLPFFLRASTQRG
jgi:hypothetical protein